MAKSREELRRELQASLGLGGTAVAERPAPAPSTNGNPFAKNRLKPAPVAVVEDEPEVEDEEIEDEDVESEESAESDEPEVADEPESSPLDELVEQCKGLIDFIVQHGESLKSWLDTAR